MLLVGGAGRNSGKTKFSCSLIERFSRRFPLVGLKVTAIREGGGPCPRGRDDCGVCTSLSGDWEITQEHGQPPAKDTSLMLAAGAERVYWLRVMRRRLAEGTAALIERIGAGTVCICESNSLRRVVEPGLFIIVKRKDDKKLKRSAREVLHLADRVVIFEDPGFDVSAADLELQGGTWTWKAP